MRTCIVYSQKRSKFCKKSTTISENLKIYKNLNLLIPIGGKPRTASPCGSCYPSPTWPPSRRYAALGAKGWLPLSNWISQDPLVNPSIPKSKQRAVGRHGASYRSIRPEGTERDPMKTSIYHRCEIILPWSFIGARWIARIRMIAIMLSMFTSHT